MATRFHRTLLAGLLFSLNLVTCLPSRALDTDKIQALIDAVPASGGICAVPPGTYICGTLHLRSNLIFQLAPGAQILGSRNIADYDTNVETSVESPSFSKCVVYAKGATNLTIEGPGTIDGRGTKEAFPSSKNGPFVERPMLMRFIDCSGLRLQNLNLRDAASWCCHFVDCEDVRIEGVNVRSLLNRNNDGFDLDGCRDIFISDCNLNTEDDAICGKSTLRATENLLVTNCKLTSRTAGFKLGTSSAVGFKDIMVNHCLFRNCPMGAIKLLCVDGGTLENVTMSDILMDNVEGPLFIRLGARGIRYDEPKEIADDVATSLKKGEAPPGVLRHVVIRDVQAQISGREPKSMGILITGIPGHPIEDITLENFDITFPGGGTAGQAAATVPENGKMYPEQSSFGVLPVWGAYIRHVNGINFVNVKLHSRQTDARPPWQLEDVVHAEVRDLFVNDEPAKF